MSIRTARWRTKHFRPSEGVAIDISPTLDTPASPEELFEAVADLESYPHWLSIIDSVEPDVDSDADAWIITLVGRIGPLKRSKRIRMSRTLCDAPRSVRFERIELDDREHSEWTLDAVVTPIQSGSSVAMNLHYGGSLWMPVLDRLLIDEIETSKRRLSAHLGSR